ncbi:MAG: hypothetical protein ACLFSB_01090 [Chitinispirillaceae bacterium]
MATFSYHSAKKNALSILSAFIVTYKEGNYLLFHLQICSAVLCSDSGNCKDTNKGVILKGRVVIFEKSLVQKDIVCVYKIISAGEENVV